MGGVRGVGALTDRKRHGAGAPLVFRTGTRLAFGAGVCDPVRIPPPPVVEKGGGSGALNPSIS